MIELGPPLLSFVFVQAIVKGIKLIDVADFSFSSVWFSIISDLFNQCEFYVYQAVAWEFKVCICCLACNLVWNIVPMFSYSEFWILPVWPIYLCLHWSLSHSIMEIQLNILQFTCLSIFQQFSWSIYVLPYHNKWASSASFSTLCHLFNNPPRLTFIAIFFSFFVVFSLVFFNFFFSKSFYWQVSHFLINLRP